MAVIQRDLDVPGVTRPMTYEEYMASPEEMARYDILDGWKVYRLYGEQQLPNPTRAHQRIVQHIARAFEDYESRQQTGQAIVSPCDIHITFRPLHTRQPDVLYISSERLAQNPPSDDPSPLSPAPELVVEVISPSDRPAVLDAKITDYRAVDVREVWIVRSQERTVEVVSLSLDKVESVGTYALGQSVPSGAFEGLTVAVDDIFTA